MTNRDIARILHEIGTLLEIRGENSFKCRAYINAARSVESCPQDLRTLSDEDRLGTLPGIGEALQDKITTLLRQGSLPYYDELKSSFAPGVFDLLRIPGLGPKKVGALLQELNIDSLDKLESACRDGSLHELPGFGEKTATKLLHGLEQIRQYRDLHHCFDLLPVAEDLVDTLLQHPAATRASLTGTLRRGHETAKEIDLLVSSKKPQDVIEDFIGLEDVASVRAKSNSHAAVVLQGGIPCTVRIVNDREFGSALHYYTGSDEHNAQLLQRAKSCGVPLDEWAPQAESPGSSAAFRSEEELYDALGLDFIPPELREGSGEIAAAEEHRLPRLVEWTQLRGCFHNHTTASDGHNTLEQMAKAAEAIGLEYLGLADHSKSSIQANGLPAERLLAQIQTINEHNRQHPDLHLFSGIECDILKDGSLDFDDDILSRLDYVVASVHSSFALDEKEMTARVIRAMENRYVTMLGHPTGRLLLEREAYAINMDKIIDCAAATGTWIELNANPWRLDMDWRYWHKARDKGVKCVINPDAHAIAQLGYLKLGVQMARKGWLEKDDVINCLPLREIKKCLSAKRG